STDAADLSQEILLNLCTVDLTEIQCMDAFLRTVCRYTWSKFLRKNKPAWDTVTVSGELSDYVDFTDGDTPEEHVIQCEVYDRLRREVMYLSGVRRDIILLHYYDRKNAPEIGKRLGLAPSTVRWHLSRIRSDLKERITMTDEIYRPQKLSIGHYGNWHSDVYRALESDILMQNICLICRRQALSIEDISRTLGVAAVYLEDKISRLLSMDYMVEQNGKFRTNFFIQDVPFKLAHLRYQMEHVPFVAEQYYRAVSSVFPDIQAVGFVGYGLPENELMWDILTYFLMREISRTDDRMLQELHLEHGAPMRPYGSRHWVRAGVSQEELNASPEMTDDMRVYLEKTGTYGLKSSSNFDGTVRSYQFDLKLFGETARYGRMFDSYYVSALAKAAELERRGETIDDFDREQFAMMVRDGYIVVEEDKVRMNLPYFTRAERAKVDALLDGAADTMERDAIYRRFTGYASYIDRFLPDYVSVNERAHYKTSFDPHAAVLWHLTETGRLRLPANLAAACTVLYEWGEE
ncbi:MAG: RNA polymerase sigma factor, partial [Eubacteriales bacterium]